jgi:hypothetical protein
MSKRRSKPIFWAAKRLSKRPFPIQRFPIFHLFPGRAHKAVFTSLTNATAARRAVYENFPNSSFISYTKMNEEDAKAAISKWCGRSTKGSQRSLLHRSVSSSKAPITIATSTWPPRLRRGPSEGPLLLGRHLLPGEKRREDPPRTNSFEELGRQRSSRPSLSTSPRIPSPTSRPPTFEMLSLPLAALDLAPERSGGDLPRLGQLPTPPPVEVLAKGSQPHPRIQKKSRTKFILTCAGCANPQRPEPRAFTRAKSLYRRYGERQPPSLRLFSKWKFCPIPKQATSTHFFYTKDINDEVVNEKITEQDHPPELRKRFDPWTLRDDVFHFLRKASIPLIKALDGLALWKRHLEKASGACR